MTNNTQQPDQPRSYWRSTPEARQQQQATEGIWTMTESEFAESLRSAKEQAWEEGWQAGAGWPQIEDNPYKVQS